MTRDYLFLIHNNVSIWLFLSLALASLLALWLRHALNKKAARQKEVWLAQRIAVAYTLMAFSLLFVKFVIT